MNDQIKKLYILRHGETNLNTNKSQDRIIKQPENTPLNENGIVQAKKTGEYLKVLLEKSLLLLPRLKQQSQNLRRNLQ